MYLDSENVIECLYAIIYEINFIINYNHEKFIFLF